MEKSNKNGKEELKLAIKRVRVVRTGVSAAGCASPTSGGTWVNSSRSLSR